MLSEYRIRTACDGFPAAGWLLFEEKPMGAGDLSASEIFFSDNLGSQSAAPIGLDYFNSMILMLLILKKKGKICYIIL